MGYTMTLGIDLLILQILVQKDPFIFGSLQSKM
jgi:hypothetical protein